jgi:hypothetical protein
MSDNDGMSGASGILLAGLVFGFICAAFTRSWANGIGGAVFIWILLGVIGGGFRE